MDESKIDVRIPIPDWIALRGKALFFLPGAVEFKNRPGLSNIEWSRKASGHGIKISSALIGQVLRLEPVTFERASLIFDSIDKISYEKGFEPVLKKIIASVFFLERNPLRGEYREEVAIRARQLGLSDRAIEVASGGFRVPLSVCLKILQAESGQRNLSEQQIIEGIGTRASYAIRTAYRLKGEPPLAWSDLVAAPRSGHPWSLVVDQRRQA